MVAKLPRDTRGVSIGSVSPPARLRCRAMSSRRAVPLALLALALPGCGDSKDKSPTTPKLDVSTTTTTATKLSPELSKKPAAPKVDPNVKTLVTKDLIVG